MPLAPELLKPLTRLNLGRLPVAMAFLDAPPAGLARVDHAQAAGCGYWRQASDGQACYTTAEDHQNCPIGAFTHGVTLPPAKAAELQSLVGTMIRLQYLKGEEVAGIPHREQPMKLAAYAPLGTATFEPDVVIFHGNAKQIMLISEAARAAGAFGGDTTMGRPACAVVPQAMATSGGLASVGCIGNRVYTELGDDELYVALPGTAVRPMLASLDTIVTANVELEAFHRQRAATLS